MLALAPRPQHHRQLDPAPPVTSARLLLRRRRQLYHRRLRRRHLRQLLRLWLLRRVPLATRGRVALMTWTEARARVCVCVRGAPEERNATVVVLF